MIKAINKKKLENRLEDKYTTLGAYNYYKDNIEDDLIKMLDTTYTDWIDYDCVDNLKSELNRLEYLIEECKEDIKNILDQLIEVNW